MPMQRYAYQPKSSKAVRVAGNGLRISAKSAAVICRALTGMSLPKARLLADGLRDERRSLGGKFYTKTAAEIATLLEQAEKNAEFQSLAPERLIVHASAHEGFTFYTPRRFKLRRKMRKVAHVQVVCEYH